MTSKHCVNVNFKGRETSRRKVSEHSHCPCFGIHTLAAAAFVCICFGDKPEDTYWREQHKPFEKNDVYCFQDGLPRDFKQTILFKKALISQLRQPFLPWLLRDKASVQFWTQSTSAKMMQARAGSHWFRKSTILNEQCRERVFRF